MLKKISRTVGLLLALLVSSISSFGQKIGSLAPQVKEWKVGDKLRKALVYIPPGAKTVVYSLS